MVLPVHATNMSAYQRTTETISVTKEDNLLRVWQQLTIHVQYLIQFSGLEDVHPKELHHNLSHIHFTRVV